MIVAMIGLILSWDKGIIHSALLIGLTFCAFVWGVNHVANPDSYCWLTDLEKHYREVNEVEPCSNDFLPRFYRKCREIVNGKFFNIPE
jgi:hypothetical protein